MVAHEERSRPPRPLLRMVVGGVLRRTRIRQGRTLAEVAKAAGISIPYLSELERGRKEASSEVLAAVCEGLRITLSELVTEVGREILDGQTPRASVITLDAFRARRSRRARHGETRSARADEVHLRRLVRGRSVRARSRSSWQGLSGGAGLGVLAA